MVELGFEPRTHGFRGYAQSPYSTLTAVAGTPAGPQQACAQIEAGSPVVMPILPDTLLHPPLCERILTQPQFSPLENGDNSKSAPIGLLRELTKARPPKSLALGLA